MKFINFLSKISLHHYFTVSAGFTIGLRPRDRSELIQGVFLSFFSNGLQVLDLSQLGCQDTYEAIELYFFCICTEIVRIIENGSIADFAITARQIFLVLGLFDSYWILLTLEIVRNGVGLITTQPLLKATVNSIEFILFHFLLV